MTFSSRQLKWHIDLTPFFHSSVSEIHVDRRFYWNELHTYRKSAPKMISIFVRLYDYVCVLLFNNHQPKMLMFYYQNIHLSK